MNEAVTEWYFSLGWLITILVAFYLLKNLVLEFIGQALISIPIIGSLAMWILALILLPGTVVHEISHFVAATFLFVKVNKINFWPQKTDKGVALGHILPAKKPDPFRDALIGVAPLIGGSAVLVIIVALGFRFPMPTYFLGAPHLATELSTLRTHIDLHSARDLVVLWLLFSIGNTLFPSKADTRAWLLVGVLVAALAGALWYFTRIGPSDLLARLPLSLLEAVNMAIFALTLVLILDLILVMPLFIIVWGLGALAGRRK
ncbi:MAG: hypothetical protein NUW24_07020 [Anaerolineae bacterium]|jgi:hypothetical protein|nr:hypothetical protein [Anaerolineae bacterium]MDH7472685.1 hypothetical protein [Anaerolineae bacterium]